MNNLKFALDNPNEPMINQFPVGLIIILSAPSGAGKSTIAKELINRHPEINFSVSMTSREKRDTEEEGKSYYFVTREVFEKSIRDNAFAEWAMVHGHYYGTPKRNLDECQRVGKDILLDIDVQGGENIRKLYSRAISIFILPPSFDILVRRLRGRMTEKEDILNIRTNNAKKEILELPKYDYLVVNDSIDMATSTVESIIKAERCRINRFTFSI